jgi:hypothetical protein
MIVEITSLAPTVALRPPAMPAQTAPARQAAAIASTMCGNAGMPAKEEPTQTAAIDPMMNCPCPPMLNSPARKAKATASPVRISGVVTISVCWRLIAASARSSIGHGNSHWRPVPSKMAS